MMNTLNGLVDVLITAWGIDPAFVTQAEILLATRIVVAVNVLARYDDAGDMSMKIEDAAP